MHQDHAAGYGPNVPPQYIFWTSGWGPPVDKAVDMEDWRIGGWSRCTSSSSSMYAHRFHSTRIPLLDACTMTNICRGCSRGGGRIRVTGKPCTSSGPACEYEANGLSRDCVHTASKLRSYRQDMLRSILDQKATNPQGQQTQSL